MPQKILSMTRDTNGVVDFGFNVPPETYSMTLSIAEVATLAIPAGHSKVVFTASQTGDFIVSGEAVTDPGTAGAPTLQAQFPINLPWRTDLVPSGFTTDVHIKCLVAGDIYICFYTE